MTPGKLATVFAVAWLAAFGLQTLFLMAVWPDPHRDLPTAGVAGCTGASSRTVVVPAGATTAFSCPTHIQVSSMDEHIATKLTLERP